MDRFVRIQNIERYRRLIESVNEDGSSSGKLGLWDGHGYECTQNVLFCRQ